MRLQMALQGTKILVIDEMSMISPGFLYKVNRRLQQAFPENKTKPFGGISVLIMGGELYQIEATLLISNPFPLPLLHEYHENKLKSLLLDFAQLPPVMAPPLYQVKQKNALK